MVVFIATLPSLNAQVWINELCPANSTVLTDETGATPDWIELYNSGQEAAALKGWSLADHPQPDEGWIFPDITLEPGEHFIVLAAGESRKDLCDHWETVVYDSAQWRYWWGYENPPEEWFLPSFNDSSWQQGPGGFGRGPGIYNTTVPDTIPTIFIRTSFYLEDTARCGYGLLNVDYDDAFVAYLNGIEIARSNIGYPGKIQNWDDIAFDIHQAVMHTGGAPENFRLSEKMLDTLLRPGENILALAGFNAWNNNGNSALIPFFSVAVKDTLMMADTTPEWFSEPLYYLKSSFRLNAAGEGVWLFDSTGAIQSLLEFPPLLDDHSFGLFPDGSFTTAWFGDPTPGTANLTPPAQGYAKKPVMNLNSGFFDTTVTLFPVNLLPGDTLRYTTDGSQPADTSAIWVNPVTVDTNTIVRTRFYRSGKLPGPVTTTSLIFDPKGDLPAISLSMNPHDLWDWEEGIYVPGPNASPVFPYFGANFWQDWPKPAQVELFDTTGEISYSAGTEVLIHGGYSRAYDMKSLRLLLGDKNLQPALQGKIYPTKDAGEYRRLILRNSGQDFCVTHLRDGLMSLIVSRGTDIDYQAWQPAVVWLNGRYWGIHNFREKIDRYYTLENFGVPEDSVEILRDNIKVVEGDYTHYLKMIELIRSFGSMDSSDYDTLSKLLDISNYTDYFIAEIWVSNMDWPLHNTKYWRRKPDGRWRYILTDTDFGLGLTSSPSTNDLQRVLYGSFPWADNHLAFRKLLTFGPYRKQMINRTADLLNTRFKTETTLALTDSLRELLSSEMERHMPRWGKTVDYWQLQMDLVSGFISQRNHYMRQHYVDEFGLSGTDTLNFGVTGTGTGKIKINTIVPGEYPWEGIYFGGNEITLTALPDSGSWFSHWHIVPSLQADTTEKRIEFDPDSVQLAVAVFSDVPPPQPDLIITEINYRSADTLNPGDWFEIYNRDTVEMNLKGWMVTDNQPEHLHKISQEVSLPPGTYFTLCRDTMLFRSVFPDTVPYYGPFGFGLSAENDEIKILSPDSIEVFTIHYLNQSPWPEDADGTGKTIQLTDIGADATDPLYWASGCIGGTPSAPFEPCDTAGIRNTGNLQPALSVFPVPASDKLLITGLPKINEPWTLGLQTLTGEELFSTKLNAQGKQYTMKISLPSLPAGVYILNFSSSTGFITRKVVIR
ncbi:MAG: hypothetical protein Kow00127_05110 [Bacteroidales bacterium]